MEHALKKLGKKYYNELFKDGKNKILLSLLNDESFYNNSIINGFTGETLYWYLKDKDMFSFIEKYIYDYFSFNLINNKDYVSFKLMDKFFKSNVYCIDNNGICKDNDFSSVRYILIKTGKFYKMKISKFIHKLLNDVPLPEVAKHWYAEVFAEKWKAYCLELSSVKLYTGSKLEDFVKIYSDSKLGSCMYGGDHASFYVNSVDATAAWLENTDGKVLARCIIYNKVYDTCGNVYRLAERQYSDKEYYKELLVAKLIKAELIDGYKKIGADCHSSKNFLTNDGNKLINNFLYIYCNLYPGSIISYQDSFKNYDVIRKIATNYNLYISLGTTSPELSDKEVFPIKCPNCGKYFFHREFTDGTYFYCSDECKSNGGLTHLDNGAQIINVETVYEYSDSLKKRIAVSKNVSNDMNIFEYHDRFYSKHYSIIDGIKVPTEIVICQYSLKGELIAEYANSKEAIKKLNKKNTRGIDSCCKGSAKTSYGFIWKYKE